jgi:hypothetical protein
MARSALGLVCGRLNLLLLLDDRLLWFRLGSGRFIDRSVLLFRSAWSASAYQARAIPMSKALAAGSLNCSATVRQVAAVRRYSSDLLRMYTPAPTQNAIRTVPKTTNDGRPSLGQVGGAELAGYGEMPPSWRSLPIPRIDSIYLPFAARRPCSPRRVWTGPCLRKQRRVPGIPLAYTSVTLRPWAIDGNCEVDRKVASKGPLLKTKGATVMEGGQAP